VPRHVVLLTRDASLVVAVKALLGDEDRVIELESPQELPPVGELPVDAVVIDLPSASRKASIERVRGRFSGPLVVLLEHGEDPAKARITYRCSVLTRPFGMSQLWSLLVDSDSEALTEIIPAVQRDAPPPDVSRTSPRGRPESAPVSKPPARGTAPETPAPGRPPAGGRYERSDRPERPAAPAPERVERPPAAASEWVERPAAASERVERPAAAAPERVERPAAAAAEGPAGAATERPPAPALGRPGAASERRPPPAPPPSVPERAEGAEVGEAAAAARATRAARGQAAANARPEPAAGDGGRVAAWSWRLRRFQHPEPQAPAPGELTEPMPAVPPAPPTGNGVAPTLDRAERPPLPPAAHAAQARPQVEVEPPAPAPRPPVAEEVAPDPPETVAGRLAERLGADTVALLLDNNRGLLEVAGGVGLTAAERQLQVEYGHEVLLELFRVGVGLIEDTDRVRPLLRGIPGSRSQSLVMVPLVHEGHGFGALIIGRTSPPDQPRPEFTEPEIEALMDFAEDVAAPLRSTVLLRRLKGQLNTPGRT
jgi:GAF domain